MNSKICRKIGLPIVTMVSLLVYLTSMTSAQAQEVAQYGFEGNVLDTSGNGHSGTNNAVTFTTGMIGAQAGVFNGTTAYVNLNNPTTTGPLKPALPVTICAWVYLTNTTGVQRIFSSDNTDNSTVIAGYDLSIASGALACDYGDGLGAGPAHRRSILGSMVLTTGQWYHVAAVIQGPTNMQLYVNGLPINGNYSGTGGTMTYTTATSKIGTANTSQYFNGNIDDLRIYNSALNADEIGMIAQGALAYWGLDEGTGTTTADDTGDAFLGTLTNSPTWTTGVDGDAVSFNGTNNSINMGNASSVNTLKPGLPITIGAWVKITNTTGIQRIFSGDNADNITVFGGYDLSISGGVLFCDYGDGGGAGPAHRRSKIGTTTLTAGTWYYLSAVIRGPTNMSLYVNGVDDGGTYSGTGGTMAYTSTTSKMGTGSTSNYFNGTLDDVSVYNNALSGVDVGATPTVGGGTLASPAVGPPPTYGIGGSGFTLIKNWDFGTNGTIKNITDMDTNFMYHDQFNTYNDGGGHYGANVVASSSSTAISGQPYQGELISGVAVPTVRTFFTDYMQTYVVPLGGATVLDPFSHNAGSGSFQAKFTLPNGGKLLGHDIIWETKIRFVPMPQFWFAIWTSGNSWNQGAEDDIVESYGFQDSGGDNLAGHYWHSNSFGSNSVNYSAWPPGMISVGYHSFDPTQYHTWTVIYKADNTYANYLDGTLVQSGSMFWTVDNVDPANGGVPINMSFIFDGSWGSTIVGNNEQNLNASQLAGTFYEWAYSRIYER